MNFVFILDTSFSMSQTFDGISFFDSAKSVIKKFIQHREWSNIKNQKSDKIDRYFLMTLNEKLDESLISNWVSCPEHLLAQLNALKITYDFTNIDNAIKNAFNLINCTRIIGTEKHIYGRLFSKIQNSYIIILTDGGQFSNSSKLFNNEYNSINLINTNDITFENTNNNNNEESFPKIYNELYRWDQTIYSIILTDNENKNIKSYEILSKYSKLVGGKVYTVKNNEALNMIMSELNEKVLNTNRVNIQFIINKSRKKKLITQIENIYENNNEKWPFPDEVIINKSMKKLPAKKSIPVYEISNLIKYNISIPKDIYDIYEITDKKFIVNLLAFSNATIDLKLKDFLLKFNDTVFFEVIIDISDNDIYKKPFAILKLLFQNKIIDDIKNFNDKNISLGTYFENLVNNNNNKNNELINEITCYFLNLPYYYEEFISIMERNENNKLIKTELQIILEKYFKKIPFYYKIYILMFLNSKNILPFNKKNIMNEIEKEYINEKVSYEIKILTMEENKVFNNIKNEYNKNLRIHKTNNCYFCKRENLYNNKYNNNNINNNNYKNNNIYYDDNNDTEYNNFLLKCLNINNNNFIIKNNNNNNIYNKHNIEIDYMGDYRECFIKANHPKEKTIAEDELKYLLNDLFGNQLRPRKEVYFSYKYIRLNGMNNINKNNIIFADESNIEMQDELSVINNRRNRDNNININNNKTINNNKKNNINNETILNNIDNSSIISNTLDTPSEIYSSLSDNELINENYSNNLIEEFKNTEIIYNDNNNIDNNIDNKKKISIKYNIEMENLYKWKFNKEIKKYSKKFLNSFNDREDIIQLVKEILNKEKLFIGYNKKIEFIEKIIKLGNNYGLDRNKMKQLNNIYNSIK